MLLIWLAKEDNVVREKNRSDMVVLILLVEDALLGEDDDANTAAVNSDDENTAMAMPKINIAVVTNKIVVIKDEYNIPNMWWVMFVGLGVTSYM